MPAWRTEAGVCRHRRCSGEGVVSVAESNMAASLDLGLLPSVVPAKRVGKSRLPGLRVLQGFDRERRLVHARESGLLGMMRRRSPRTSWFCTMSDHVSVTLGCCFPPAGRLTAHASGGSTARCHWRAGREGEVRRCSATGPIVWPAMRWSKNGLRLCGPTSRPSANCGVVVVHVICDISAILARERGAVDRDRRDTVAAISASSFTRPNEPVAGPDVAFVSGAVRVRRL